MFLRDNHKLCFESLETKICQNNCFPSLTSSCRLFLFTVDIYLGKFKFVFRDCVKKAFKGDWCCVIPQKLRLSLVSKFGSFSWKLKLCLVRHNTSDTEPGAAEGWMDPGPQRWSCITRRGTLELSKTFAKFHRARTRPLLGPCPRVSSNIVKVAEFWILPYPCETPRRSVDSSRGHTALPTYCDSAKSEWWRPESVSGLVW